MGVLDDRIIRTLQITGYGKGTSLNGEAFTVTPGSSRMSYAGDFYESPGALKQDLADKLEALSGVSNEEQKKLSDAINKRIDEIIEDRKKLAADYMAGHSFIHPYALLRLNGVSSYSQDLSPDNDKENGFISSTDITNIYDIASNSNSSNNTIFKKWYEPNSSIGMYAKNPTTSDIINWGNSDVRGRFPYMFQDFVYCKYWNKIENNRLITLRRYPAPVVDAVEPNRYNANENELKESLQSSKAPFAPLATAITYFGGETENKLKDILAFSYKYEWEEASADIWQTSSQQIEESKAINSESNFLQHGIGTIAKGLGIINDFKSTIAPKEGGEKINVMHAMGLPPDPYINGPYENRVLGPVNVIQKTYKRKRGLTFSHDGLNIVFEYVSRPISNVNNKAILLDLLSNILAITYSSGTFYGGLHRYRNEHPAVYPWRNTDSLNKLYSGKLFGKGNAFRTLLDTATSDSNFRWITNLTSSLINGVKAMASDILNAITGGRPLSDSENNNNNEANANAESSAKKDEEKDKESVFQTAGRVVASRLLKNQTIPYLNNARALLTGEPVGDWHLTIGNPLNPILTIGNLIVKDSKIEFTEELGPDDFPIGFKATITLAHGLGRDKDSIEAMFNRGIGRM